MIWFDAHLDLACLAVCGRDMTRPPEEAKKPAWGPAAATLPSLAEGGVAFALATVFIEQVPGVTAAETLSAEQYREGNIDEAVRRGRAQLEVYETWRDMGLVKIEMPACLKADPQVGAVRGGMGVSEVVVPALAKRAAKLASEGPLRIGVLIEGADSVRSPEDLGWWKSRGVVAMGLAWAKSSRYAQGNLGLPIQGLGEVVGVSDIGRAMVRACDALGIVHDLSHLSDRACEELLAMTDAPIMASHSNCRELLGGESGGKNQRHLRDATIFEIGRRGGVVGLNLFGKFLRQQPPHEGEGRPTIDHALDHVERVCAVIGHRRSVGLGSDMDGGFGALAMCEGVERPAHLAKLALGLGARGWSEEEIDGFTHLNWLRFWEARA